MRDRDNVHLPDPTHQFPILVAYEGQPISPVSKLVTGQICVFMNRAQLDGEMKSQLFLYYW